MNNKKRHSPTSRRVYLCVCMYICTYPQKCRTESAETSVLDVLFLAS